MCISVHQCFKRLIMRLKMCYEDDVFRSSVRCLFNIATKLPLQPQSLECLPATLGENGPSTSISCHCHYPVTIMTYQRSSAPVPSSPQSTGVDRVPVGRILRQCCPAAVLDGGCGAGGVYSTHTPTWAQRKGFSDGQTQSPVDRPGRPPGGTVQLGGKSKGTFQEDW